MWKRPLLSILFIVAILSFFSISACQSGPSKTETYAKEHNLWKQDVAILSQLEFEANTLSLIDQLSSLPPSVQEDENTLNYLKEVSADRKVSENELSRMVIATKVSKLNEGQPASVQNISYLSGIPYVLSNKNPNLAKAYDYLQSVSDKAVSNIVPFGIDDNVTDYIVFVSTLPDTKFAQYVLESRLCIRDRMLTDLEKRFLQDPDKYAMELHDAYTSQIDAIDPELASKLMQLPYWKDKPEIKTLRSLENILGLALNPKAKSIFETIYGKGIDRKMWPVALERLFYKGFEKDFDMNNLSDDQDIQICIKLAEFQQKYNKEMDQDGVPGMKPAIRGMNYDSVPAGWIWKSDDDIKFDFALMRWGLRCNTATIWYRGPEDSDRVFDYVDVANGENLDTWLQIDIWKNPEISIDEYNNWLIDCSKNSENHHVKVLSLGNEIDLWWKEFGGYNCQRLESGYPEEKISNFLIESSKLARQYYSGQITYFDWESPERLDWSPIDIVSLNILLRDNPEQFSDYISNMKKLSLNKPFVISKTGSLTTSNADKINGLNYPQLLTQSVNYDMEKQASLIDTELRLIYEAGTYGVSIYNWDGPAIGDGGVDYNKFGFSIWDYINMAPKLSFWTVYKYYKD